MRGGGAGVPSEQTPPTGNHRICWELRHDSNRPGDPQGRMIDVLISNGWVADGTGNPRYPADVAIQGDRIVAVERLTGAQATQTIDATGKIVCPGFVDAHSHSDWSLFANPTAESTIRQGVTTEVVGNCGESFAPFTERARAHLTDRLA